MKKKVRKCIFILFFLNGIIYGAEWRKVYNGEITTSKGYLIDNGNMYQFEYNGIINIIKLKTWQKTESISIGNYISAWKNYNSKIYLCQIDSYNNCKLLLSEDYCKNWIELEQFNGVGIANIKLFGSDTILLSGADIGLNSVFYLSTNSGTEFQESKVTGTGIVIGTVATSGNTIFAVTANGYLLKSLDNGDSFIIDTNFYATKNRKISFIAIYDNIIVIGGQDGLFVYSTDNGESWNDMAKPLNNTYTIQNLYFISKNDLIFCAFNSDKTKSFIYRTTNFGNSWNSELETNDLLHHINKLDDTLLFAASTKGSIWVKDNRTSVNDDTHLFNNNSIIAFGNKIILNHDCSFIENTEFFVYDVYGKLMPNAIEHTEITEHGIQITIDDNLSRGVYFLSVNNAGKRQIYKFNY